MGNPFDAAWAVLKASPYDTPEDLQTQGLNLPHSTTADEANPYLDAMQAEEDQKRAEEKQRMMALQTTPAPNSTLPPKVEEYLRQIQARNAAQSDEYGNMQAEEEAQMEYMEELERRQDAGEFVPTDIFDEGGKAAAGEGYMSGGRPY